ncbi:unnamed protein product, partial [Prorocentrum cordatum]
MCPGRGGGRTWTSYHGPPRGGRRPPGDLPGGEEVVPGEDLRRQKLWFHHYDRTVALLCHRRRQLSQRGVATFYHESPQAAAARQFHRRCTTSRRCSTASGPGASDASRPRAPRGARPPEVSPAAGHRSGAERLEARAPEWPPAPRSQGEVERVPLQGYFSLSAQNPPVGGQARQNPRAQGAAGRGVEGTARAPRPARGGSCGRTMPVSIPGPLRAPILLTPASLPGFVRSLCRSVLPSVQGAGAPSAFRAPCGPQPFKNHDRAEVRVLGAR